jgi:glycosyltransferase involved in cell wall biosynthesis
MRRKARVYGRIDLTIVSPSSWLARLARESSLLGGRRVEVIPNGLDTEIFKPIDRVVARHSLNLPTDGPVVLFGARWLADPRKGGDLLYEALGRFGAPCTLLTFGEGNLPACNLPNVTLRSLGALDDERAMAMVYSAADVFAAPSREDNLPNTVAEALACGTPCVAFDVGGLSDLIVHGKNGYLAARTDPGLLLEAIRFVIDHPNPGSLRAYARERAVKKYSRDVVTRQYVGLYEELIAGGRGDSARCSPEFSSAS